MQLPRKVQCLERLLLLTNISEDMLAYLIDEKIISLDDASGVRQSSDRALALHVLLEKARTTEKLLLLDYEWTILPVERIRILMVSERNQKAFGHNYA